jgi:hypothetical protein
VALGKRWRDGGNAEPVAEVKTTLAGPGTAVRASFSLRLEVRAVEISELRS